MTKRSKTTLFALLALIAAFGLILTGCPDAAGSSETTKEVPVPADVVKVTGVKFTNGVSSGAAVKDKLEFNVVLPSDSWDEDAVAAAVASGSIANYFDIDLAATTIDLTTGYSWTATPTGTTLAVKIEKDSIATDTINTRASIALRASRSVNLKALITGNKVLPISSATAVWKYDDADDAALITVDEVSFVDGDGSGLLPVVTVKLGISKGTWIGTLNGTSAPAFVDAPTLGTGTLGTTILVTGGGGSTLTITYTGASATTAYGTATLTLDPTEDISTGVYSGVQKVLFDLDTATTVARAVTLGTGSQGVASYKSIIGLTADATYLVLRSEIGNTNTEWYKVNADGTLQTTALTELSGTAVGPYATGLTGTAITGLDESRYAYDVYLYGVLASGAGVGVTSATTGDLVTGAKNAVADVSALTNDTKTFKLLAGASNGTVVASIYVLTKTVIASQTTPVSGTATQLGNSQTVQCTGIKYTTDSSISSGGAATTLTATNGKAYFVLSVGTAGTTVTFTTAS